MELNIGLLDFEKDDDAAHYFLMLERVGKFLICLSKQRNLPIIRSYKVFPEPDCEKKMTPKIYVKRNGEIIICSNDFGGISPVMLANQDYITWAFWPRGRIYTLASAQYEDAKQEFDLLRKKVRSGQNQGCERNSELLWHFCDY
jgi:hypothetical protein